MTLALPAINGSRQPESVANSSRVCRPSVGPRLRTTLEGVIDRARRFNAIPGHVIEVAELIVFGSYLDPTKDRLGDLDLAVKFRDLLPDATPDQRMKKRLAYSRASGRQFRLNAELSWPENEAAPRAADPTWHPSS
jgi:predicted nucleotidyltransferase